jgi:thymidylate synthase ThyX
MSDFSDATHRPHAIHTGEIPRVPITYGPDSLQVTLDTWGPQESLFPALYDALQANWGEDPSRTIEDRDFNGPDVRVPARWASLTGWNRLTDVQRTYVESCFAGRTLQQVLEGISFHFCIDGVSRAFTHQNVRTRLGAGFMQHGGRDNDWRHRAWTMPETVRRACDAYAKFGTSSAGQSHCVTNWTPINEYVIRETDLSLTPSMSLSRVIREHLDRGKRLYAALVDAGIPWQDARRVLPMGTQTYIHDEYNYLALAGVLANRLEHVMDWEFNCVAQLMLREIKIHCPPLLSKYLGSHSDKAGVAKFAGLESWPPDGKYPVPDEHASKPRTHRPEQMPFFVLHPASMAGGPVQWIPTNGRYPHEVLAQFKQEAK